MYDLDERIIIDEKERRRLITTGEPFDCCSRYDLCVMEGCCVCRDHGMYGKYIGHLMVPRCTLAKRIWVQGNTAYAFAMMEAARTIACPSRPLPEVSPSEYELFKQAVQAVKMDRTIRTSSGNGEFWTHIIAGIKYRGSEVRMPKENIIQQKDGMQLVSWMHQDIMHYAIKSSDGGYLELFRPTPHRRGHALRSYVIDIFQKRQLSEYFGKWEILTMDASKVKVGNVIAYEAKLGEVVFAKITQLTPSLAIAIKHNGGEALWIFEKLQEHIDERKVMIIAESEVPEKYRSWNA